VARVPYLSRQDATLETEAVWRRVEAERKQPTANIFLALAHAPALLRDESELDAKLRELAILTVGYATKSEYEIAHHQSHALQAGVTPEQLADVATFHTSDAFDDTEKAVMFLAEESTLTVDVSDERWAAARAHLTDKQLVELSMNIAWYNSGVRIMGLLGIDLEDNYKH
jgi:AhpD family alkylhydroperoxidase